MAGPSSKTIKQLFALSGNICAFPGCRAPLVEPSGTVIGEVCHICARNKGGPRFNIDYAVTQRDSFENLVLMCGSHHKMIDSDPGTYTEETLRELKERHERIVRESGWTPKEGLVRKVLDGLSGSLRSLNNIAINSPGSIQHNTVTIHTGSRKLQIAPPPGTIGADQGWTRYLQYLISRYNEFAVANGNEKKRFSYGAISKNIETRFGSPWKLLPMAKAQDVSIYLQLRISKTMQARINTGKGYRSFSSYHEFCHKHGLDET